MPPRTSRPASTSTLLPPILALLHPSDPSTTPPNAYSAHQKALTTVARIQGQAPGVAVDICFAVARELLKLDTAAPQEEGEEASKGKTQGQGQGQGEAGSAVELAVKGLGIAEGLEGEGEARMATITQLIALTPSTSSGPWRKKLVDAAVKYSVAVHDGASPAGDAGLHHYVGELYYRDHDFILAEPHLIASAKRDSAVTLAKMMFEWSQKGTLDPGPYAIRGVLPYLLHQPPSILPASTFLSTFLSLLSSSSSPAVQFLSTAPSIPESPLGDIQLTSSPTLNFLQLAILTVQRAPAVGASAVQARGTDGGAARDWEGLCGRYIRLGGREGVLANRDVQEALGQIGMNVFLIPPPRSAQPDMLQNLMGSLFGGGR